MTRRGDRPTDVGNEYISGVRPGRNRQYGGPDFRASRYFNPLSVLRVVPLGAGPDQYRVELDLTPEMQLVVVFPGDELIVSTRDGGRTSINSL